MKTRYSVRLADVFDIYQVVLTDVPLLQAYFRLDGIWAVCGWLSVSLHTGLGEMMAVDELKAHS